MNQEIKEVQPAIQTLNVPLHQLGERACKFPVGEKSKAIIGGFLFCGAPRDHNSPYCHKHHQVIWPLKHGGG